MKRLQRPTTILLPELYLNNNHPLTCNNAPCGANN